MSSVLGVGGGSGAVGLVVKDNEGKATSRWSKRKQECWWWLLLLTKANLSTPILLWEDLNQCGSATMHTIGFAIQYLLIIVHTDIRISCDTRLRGLDMISCSRGHSSPCCDLECAKIPTKTETNGESSHRDVTSNMQLSSGAIQGI